MDIHLKVFFEININLIFDTSKKKCNRASYKVRMERLFKNILYVIQADRLYLKSRNINENNLEREVYLNFKCRLQHKILKNICPRKSFCLAKSRFKHHEIIFKMFFSLFIF